MKYLGSILIPLFFINSTNGQKILFFNPAVDTLETNVQKSVSFYRRYLSDFKRDTVPDFNKYWSKEDCERFTYPDQLIYGINSDYPTYSMGPKRTIIYIKPDSNYINIKTHFAWLDSLQNIYTLCITNHYVKFDKNGNPYFINPIDINSRSWQSKKVRNISYLYPAYHKFNQKRSDSLIVSIEKLERDWNLKPIQILYLFADTKEELQRLRGFDYSLDMGNRDKPSGIADDRDNIVYCGGLGENYFHEIVHVYLNRLFPKSPLKEGLAVFYGGSMGHDLNWHISRVRNYLNEHTEIDLSKLDNFSYMDNYTNPISSILGLLCKSVYDKDGIEGLRRIMQYESFQDIFYKEFNVPANESNTFLRKLIDQ